MSASLSEKRVKLELTAMDAWAVYDGLARQKRHLRDMVNFSRRMGLSPSSDNFDGFLTAIRSMAAIQRDIRRQILKGGQK